MIRYNNIIISRNPQFGRCPSCNAIGTLHRSRSRNMTEQIIKKLTFFKLYRCKECGWRGYRSTIALTGKSLKIVGFYGLLMFITAYLIRLLLVNFLIN